MRYGYIQPESACGNSSGLILGLFQMNFWLLKEPIIGQILAGSRG
jgi:hypothetical protein